MNRWIKGAFGETAEGPLIVEIASCAEGAPESSARALVFRRTPRYNAS
jgi:hypothetical protein